MIECKECNKRFSSLFCANVHRRQHSDRQREEYYYCGLRSCCRKFRKYSNFVAHLKLHKRSQFDVVSSGKSNWNGAGMHRGRRKEAHNGKVSRPGFGITSHIQRKMHEMKRFNENDDSDCTAMPVCSEKSKCYHEISDTNSDCVCMEEIDKVRTVYDEEAMCTTKRPCDDGQRTENKVEKLKDRCACINDEVQQSKRKLTECDCKVQGAVSYPISPRPGKRLNRKQKEKAESINSNERQLGSQSFGHLYGCNFCQAMFLTESFLLDHQAVHEDKEGESPIVGSIIDMNRFASFFTQTNNKKDAFEFKKMSICKKCYRREQADGMKVQPVVCNGSNKKSRNTTKDSNDVGFKIISTYSLQESNHVQNMSFQDKKGPEFVKLLDLEREPIDNIVLRSEEGLSEDGEEDLVEGELSTAKEGDSSSKAAGQANATITSLVCENGACNNKILMESTCSREQVLANSDSDILFYESLPKELNPRETTKVYMNGTDDGMSRRMLDPLVVGPCKPTVDDVVEKGREAYRSGLHGNGNFERLKEFERPTMVQGMVDLQGKAHNSKEGIRNNGRIFDQLLEKAVKKDDLDGVKQNGIKPLINGITNISSSKNVLPQNKVCKLTQENSKSPPEDKQSDNYLQWVHNVNENDVLRPFKCRICSHTFTREWNLKNHMRSHTGERPFSCHVCFKGFIMKHHLKRHLLTHTRYVMQTETKLKSESGYGKSEALWQDKL